MLSMLIPKTAHFMMTLPVQNEFYGKTLPKTTKIPVSAHEMGKNTEKSTSMDHFPNEAGRVFLDSPHTQPRTLFRQITR
jgi:hypothetical protein